MAGQGAGVWIGGPGAVQPGRGQCWGDNSWHRLPGAELMPLKSGVKAPVAAWPVHSTGTVGLKILCKSPYFCFILERMKGRGNNLSLAALFLCCCLFVDRVGRSGGIRSWG